jgi:hypothetical protein
MKKFDIDNIVVGFGKSIDKTKLLDMKSQYYREDMDILEFLKLPPSPYQRNTAIRAKTKRCKDSISVLTREHLDVAIAELTQDVITDSGQLYPKGTRFINNGNTRAYYWKNTLFNISGKNIPKSDFVPPLVHATIYPCKDLKEVRQNYETFDSPNAVERDAEKNAGILLNTWEYQAKFNTFKSGYFQSALGFAAHCYDTKTYPTIASVKSVNSPGMIALYIDEIKYLGDNLTNTKFWDMPAIAGALMALKKYGTKNQKVLDFIKTLDDGEMNTPKNTPWTGTTHVLKEWSDCDVFSDHLPSWDKEGFSRSGKPVNVGFNGTVSFFLYWLEKHMDGQTGMKHGAGWDKVTTTFFDDFAPLNNALFGTP